MRLRRRRTASDPRPRAPGVSVILCAMLLGCTPPAGPVIESSPDLGRSPDQGPATASPRRAAPTPTREGTPQRPATTARPQSSAATSRPTPTFPTPSLPTPSLPTSSSGTGTTGFDPRNRFFSGDDSLYRSPWFAGVGRIMIGYGCTDAPYYDPSPRCPAPQGFHHGIDVALPCGTELRSGISGRVTDPSRPGAPGPAYGSRAFRIHDSDADLDILIGHAERVLVAPGDPVRPGQPIARVGADGAPDGCHLHLEVRPARGGVSRAIDPAPVLDLQEVR